MAQRKSNKKSQKSKLSTGAIQIIAVAVLVIVIVLATSLLLKYNQQKAEVSGEQANSALFKSTAVSLESAPIDQVRKTYKNAPEMQIDVNKKYTATVKMAKGGEFVLQLFPDKAPLTVNSFVFLAREKFFDGTTFHRVLDGFMAQGGDPMGTGGGDPGYEFVNEDSDLTFDKPGVLAMANAGRDTNGSQFFITFVPTPQLNGGYTIFGQVISGMDVVNGITRRDPQSFPNYTGDVIESITITEE
jgi:cyclophilin family peptidyl-prolyl cis-trans isomerase